MVVEYTHDEYSDMFLAFHTCSSRAGTDVPEFTLNHPGRRQQDDNVFRRLQRRLCESEDVNT